MAQTRRHHHFKICVENREYDDLEKGKVYQLLPDKKATKEEYVRVIASLRMSKMLYICR